MKLDPDHLHFIPYKGCEEFACNFNFYAYKGKWLLMDCGMGIAGKQYPMVDLLLPDPSFIEQYKDDILALVITHAHEDHIGAVPHLWPRLKCPVYCSPFTAEVLRRKIKEFTACKGMKITEVREGQTLPLKPFELEFLDITHSVLENLSTAIKTDKGTILHTGDWNLDPSPSLGKATSEDAFRKICGDGVLAYIGDSTNAQKEGSTPSEEEVRKGLIEVFKQQKNRIAITTFSSNVGRLHSIAKAAEAVGRSVVVVGRSMNNMIGAAKKCGYLNDLPPFLKDTDYKDLPRDNVVLMTTGSQGESRAALSRIANGDFKGVRLEPGDSVIFSSWKIPGNEKEINEVQNKLVASGINVISNTNSGEHIIHVSGHPCRDELKEMIAWSTPHIAVPVHGERVMVDAHGQLARDQNVPHVIVPQNGSVIRLEKENPRIIDHIETKFLGVEPRRVIPLESAAISERRKLQFTGCAFVSLVIDQKNKLLDDPQIDLIGLEDANTKSEDDTYDDIYGEIESSLIDVASNDLDDIEENIRIVVRRMLSHKYGFKQKVFVHAYCA
mgnify:CR=1 FL=1